MYTVVFVDGQPLQIKEKIYDAGTLLSLYYYHKWNTDHKKL